MSPDIALWTGAELVQAYRHRTLSPVEATRAVLDRIAALDGNLNAFRLVDDELALMAARQSEARWAKGEPLGSMDGVPGSVKDVLLTRGWSTLRGSRTVVPDQSWDEDAPVVARLREEGAVLLGKTTTPEFHWKTVTDSPLTGVTRNPWNPERTPGGSSGGAAVAVAAGMGAFALGTDGGGSIRVPCAFCGVFGLKPTFGRVPLYPPSPFGTLAHVGPITRSVLDGANLLTAIARPDVCDWYALPYDGRDYRIGLETGVRGLRVAVSLNLDNAQTDPTVADRVWAGASRLVELGARVEEASPRLASPQPTFEALWYAGLERVVSRVPADKRGLIDPGLLQAAEAGRRLTRSNYLDAVRAREELGMNMNRFHETYDLLITPAVPIMPFGLGKEVPDRAVYRRWIEWTPFSYPFNLTKQPAAVVPCGLADDGLPVGLQIVGPLYAEALVLRASRALEASQPGMWSIPLPGSNAMVPEGSKE